MPDNGVPQCPILVSLLFTLYINHFKSETEHSDVHFDVIQSYMPLARCQSPFDDLQTSLFNLKIRHSLNSLQQTVTVPNTVSYTL